MSVRKKLMTWAAIVPFIGIVGCGASQFFYCLFALLGGFYHFSCGDFESRRAPNAVYESRLTLDNTVVDLDVRKDASVAGYLEDKDLTVIGFNDTNHSILVEITTPGQIAGEWTKAEESGVYVRVKIGDAEYIAGDEMKVKLDEYVEPGGQLRGTVSGPVTGPDGELHKLNLTFDATRS